MALYLLVEIVSGLFILQDYDHSYKYIKFDNTSVEHKSIYADFRDKRTVMVEVRKDQIINHVVL